MLVVRTTLATLARSRCKSTFQMPLQSEMALQNVLSYTKRLEDPKHPLMGPNLKGLYWFGCYQTGSKLRTYVNNAFHFSTFIFVITEFMGLYEIRHDYSLMLNNMSLSIMGFMGVIKCFSLVFNQRKWLELVDQISAVERRQIELNDATTMKHMKEYTKYTRIVTYTYWAMVFVTYLFMIVSRLAKSIISKRYREDVVNGKEPLPQIIFSWFPFDNKKMPGYLLGIFIHVWMGFQLSGMMAGFDMNAVGIMSYLKGQTIILREQCRKIFECERPEIVVQRIKECHEHHNLLVKQHRMFNSLLSPPMFLYVLFCSIILCSSVVQFTSKEATTSQKIWVVEYSLYLVSQLFLYCWHGNEVAIETKEVDRGVYESDWWKGDKKLRRLVLLLGGKLDNTLLLEAGPFTTLSVPTFIEIIKGSYSFFTLLSRVQDE